MQCCRDVEMYAWEEMDVGAAGAAFDAQAGEGGAVGKKGFERAAGGAIDQQAGAVGGAGAAGKNEEAAAGGGRSAAVGTDSEEDEEEVGALRPSPVASMVLSPLALCV